MKKHRLVSNPGKYCRIFYNVNTQTHILAHSLAHSLTHALSSFSFLYKYWYIILPLALMGLFGGVEEEPVQDTSRGAPVVATTMAGAAAASGGQARQRRGKRD